MSCTSRRDESCQGNGPEHGLWGANTRAVTLAQVRRSDARRRAGRGV